LPLCCGFLTCLFADCANLLVDAAEQSVSFSNAGQSLLAFILRSFYFLSDDAAPR
jgi:hypothetical protein